MLINIIISIYIIEAGWVYTLLHSTLLYPIDSTLQPDYSMYLLVAVLQCPSYCRRDNILVIHMFILAMSYSTLLTGIYILVLY